MAARELGNALGNPLALPRKQAERSTYTRIVSGEGVLIPPQGARLMRVAVIGAGGSGSYVTSGNGGGGGGGGCAASKIVSAAPIAYSIGIGGASRSTLGNGFNGGDTTVSFGSYQLVGQGGRAGTTSGGLGGSGFGGDYNFTGGAGATSTSNQAVRGGGGAGPNGNGGDGNIRNVTFANTGWGAAGGFGGNTNNYYGGSGTGAYFVAEATIDLEVIDYPWGRDGIRGAKTGGEMGGGGAGGVSATTGAGGSGGMVVEWFY